MIVLIGNYAPDGQESMQRFGRLLLNEARAGGWEVEWWAPRPWLLFRGPNHGIRGKVPGYMDKYLFSGVELMVKLWRWRCQGKKIVLHVCDHSNAIYHLLPGKHRRSATCHDLIAIRAARGEFPWLRPAWTGRILQRAIAWGLRRAEHLICDSEATAADCRQLLDPPPTGLGVARLPVSEGFFPRSPFETEQALARYGLLPETYLLHVGGNAPYKNRMDFLQIGAEVLRRSGGFLRLVVAGKLLDAEERDWIRKEGLLPAVLQVGRVSDSDLACLYTAALALLFPSRVEGYGWPVLEAMACGCPVVASSIPVLREIGGNAVKYFDGEDREAAAGIVMDLIQTSSGERGQCREWGLAQAASFSNQAFQEPYRRWFSEAGGATDRDDSESPPFPKAMKILFVTHSLDPLTGGTAECVRQWQAALRLAGHEAEVVCLDEPGAKWLTPELPVYAMGRGWISYGYSRKLQVWLKSSIGHYNAVVSNGLWQYTGLVVRRACVSAGVPYFIFPHGMLDPWFQRAYPGKHLKKWVYWHLAEKRNLQQARTVAFTCEEERKLAAQSFGFRHPHTPVVPLGIDPPAFDFVQARQEFLKTFPVLQETLFRLFLGRIHDKKGVDLLLNAYAKLRSDGGPPGLVIAGPVDANDHAGQVRERFSRDYPDYAREVVWTGMLRGALKFGALAAADVFVLPSHQENFGLAVVEALSVGTPVLLSNRVNIWREIVDAGAGLVADDTEEGTLRLLVSWEEKTTGERDLMRRQAQACFHKYFVADQSAKALVGMLREHGVTG